MGNTLQPTPLPTSNDQTHRHLSSQINRLTLENAQLHQQNRTLHARLARLPSEQILTAAAAASTLTLLGCLGLGFAVNRRKSQVVTLQRSLAAAHSRLQTLERTAKIDARSARLQGVQALAVGVIEVAESLGRGLRMVHGRCGESGGSVTEDDMASSGFVEGVAMAEKEFRKRLGENQVVEIEPKKGDWPDTNLHQVVQMTPAEGGGVAPGTIAEILQTGWKLEERILRPASVVVAQQEVRKTEVEADTQGTGDKKEDLGAKVSATE